MPRWLAIGRAQGWDNRDKFAEEMHETKNWRADARTTITKVLALEDGRLLAECHAQKQEDFDAWLQLKGWNVESITPIKHVANVGSIWEIR